MVLLSKKQEERFTYGDYYNWPDDERWELIEGIPYSMAPPSTQHQDISMELSWQIKNFLVNNNKKCKIYTAPFGVRLPEADEANEEIDTVVQPDISVICDSEKIDEKGCKGAPDLIIEILSRSTASKDQIQKLALYEKHGVKEYWIVNPFDKSVNIYILEQDSNYGIVKHFDSKTKVKVQVIEGLKIDLNQVFAPEH